MNTNTTGQYQRYNYPYITPDCDTENHVFFSEGVKHEDERKYDYTDFFAKVDDESFLRYGRREDGPQNVANTLGNNRFDPNVTFPDRMSDMNLQPNRIPLASELQQIQMLNIADENTVRFSETTRDGSKDQTTCLPDRFQYLTRDYRRCLDEPLYVSTRYLDNYEK